jgi:glycosyltransferase involved in cell wall biosynthesis
MATRGYTGAVSEFHAARMAVIIPCYQDGALLTEAVASVREEEPVELIVIDDASPDRTTHEALEALQERAVKVVRHESNRGVAAARNTGLANTSAPYVLPLDSDDLLVPGILALLADLLDTHDSATVAYGDYQEFGESEKARQVPKRLDPFRLLYTNEYPQTALFRRALLEGLGGWDEDPRCGYEDWAVWMSIAQSRSTAVHAGSGLVTHYQRVHGPRLLEQARRRHTSTYRHLRDTHCELFARRSELKSASDLPDAKKLLYPIVYGRRRRFAFEPMIKETLERAGVWRRSL